MAKNPGGRPRKYNLEEALEAIDAYIAKIKASDDIPYLEELCLEMDISFDTLARYKNKWKSFAERINKISIMQKFKLQKGSLVKLYDTNSAKFQLSANHGMSETQKHQFGQDSNSEPVAFNIMTTPINVQEPDQPNPQASPVDKSPTDTQV